MATSTTLTDRELDAVVGLVAAVMNDDAGLATYGMSVMGRGHPAITYRPAVGNPPRWVGLTSGGR